ncbi:MAG: DNA polymerase II [Kiritimatiellae bacterium]|nr:DNA polymerase II [Kiritimatiellia bacterium]
MSQVSHRDKLIFGHDDTPGIIDAEHVAGKNGDEIVLFRRHGGKTVREHVPFTPCLWLARPDLLGDDPAVTEMRPLKGRGALKHLAFFKGWKDLDAAVRRLKDSTGQPPSSPIAPYFLLNDPVQQYLLQTGRTSFKGMSFGDLRRMQVDIETYTAPGFGFSNPQRRGDRIIAIAMADETGWTEVLSGAELDERGLIEKFVATVQERDPDVIEGHNIFKFDLPYLAARADLQGVKFALGRDGRPPHTRAGRFIVAERAVAYPKAEIFGRHVVDTYFLAQIYDVSHRSLESLGLKDVAVHFGVAAPHRTYIEGGEISRVFRKSPAKVMAYARDDILETRAVSNLLSPVYFAQAQILPFAYQNICVRGNAAKIDALMLREYQRQGRAIPRPDAAREFAGGYTDIFFEGVARNVHHCDIRSLYPSLMLKYKLAPASDDLGVFLDLLDYLRSFRLDIKERHREASGEERMYLGALDGTFKILINSFYGYLGFSQARFSDFDRAERIAAEGRKLLQQMIEWIRDHKGKPIEIDTDGIYFVPPPLRGEKAVDHFREAFRESLPPGIEVEFDGEYVSMFSYKMKNYALLDAQGEMIIKGAALKSRGLEPFQRDFLEEMLRLKLEGKDAQIPKLRDRYAAAILKGEWPIERLAKTETLQDAPSTYASKIRDAARGRNAAYELVLKSGRDYQAGDQVSYYVTGNRKSVAVHACARLVSDWDPKRRDENVAYYLAKLDALFKKFVD